MVYTPAIMKLRWFALGFAACCVALGVVYAVIELAGDDTQTQAIVISRADFGGLAKLQSTLSKLAVEA